MIEYIDRSGDRRDPGPQHWLAAIYRDLEMLRFTMTSRDIRSSPVAKKRAGKGATIRPSRKKPNPDTTSEKKTDPHSDPTLVIKLNPDPDLILIFPN